MKGRELRISRIICCADRLSAAFVERGVSQAQADLWSLVASLRMEGWPDSEAKAFARTYFPSIDFPGNDNEPRTQTY